MSGNTNVHDRAFKKLMRQRVFAKAFIEQHFSDNELELFDLSTLELWNASFIRERRIHQNLGNTKGSEAHSDIVYRLEIAHKPGYIVFLFEHQSQPEELMPLRMLEYNVLLMRQHIEQGHKKLPLIIPLVFYHGLLSPYPYSTDIFDCFENPRLAKHYYLKPFKLVDVTIMTDSQLKKNIITAPLQIIMKHIRDNDLLPVFRELAESHILSENAKLGDGKLLISVVNYVIRAGEISDRRAFETLLLDQTNEVRKNVMTIFEQHQHEISQGMQQGMQQGIKQGLDKGARQAKFEIAQRLLEKGLEDSLIMEATDLSLAELKKLKVELTF